MKSRTMRLHRWVWWVARRWFPWMFRFRRTPIVNRPAEERWHLRHRPHFLELERRQAPTVLSVAGMAAAPIALLGSQTPQAPEVRPSTLDRLDRSPAAGENPPASLAPSTAQPVDQQVESPGRNLTPVDSTPATNPLEDLRPHLVDQALSAGYLQGLASPETLFQDAVDTDAKAAAAHKPGPAKPKPVNDGSGGGGGGGGGKHGATTAAQGTESAAARVVGGTALSGEQLTPNSQALQMLEENSSALNEGLPGTLLENASTGENPSARSSLSTGAGANQSLSTIFNEGLPSVPNPTADAVVNPLAPPASSPALTSSSSADSPASPSSTAESAPGSSGSDALSLPTPPPTETTPTLTATALAGLGNQAPALTLGSPGSGTGTTTAALAFTASTTGNATTEFQTQDNGVQVALGAPGATFTFNSAAGTAGAAAVVEMDFAGANSAFTLVGLDAATGPPAYFPGISPVEMHSPTTTYSSVAYQDLYNGISLDFYGNQNGQLEYDWNLAAGADPGLIQLRFQGADQVSLDNQSNLVVTAGGQTLVEHAPIAYQEIGGVRQAVDASFVLEGNQVGIALGAYDPSQPLVIDPIITTHARTFLAPTQNTASQGSAPDSAGTLSLDDGNKLILAANFYSNNVTLLRPGSSGQLQEVGQLATGKGPNGFAVGDFTGNGHQDFAVANYYDNTIDVFSGDGKGNFQLAQTLATGAGPANELAVGDFTGNGKLDLASANMTDGTVSVFLGNGDGTFAPAVNYNVGSGADCITAGDFTGTGRTDLAVGNFNSSTVTVLSNQGNGTFTVGTPFSVGANPWYITAADLNGNGKADLATANFHGGVSVLLSNGDGTFQNAVNYAAGSNPTGIVAADLNGDGTPDLVVSNYGSNNVSLLLGKGDGTFQSAQQFSAAAGSGPNGLAVADIAGCGNLDVVVADQNTNAVSFLANQSLQGTVGQTFTGVLTTFTDSDPNASPADFSASITWGDGQTTQVGASAFSVNMQGTFSLTASHIFSQAGSYAGSLTIIDTQSDTATATFSIGIHPAQYGTITGSVFNDQTGSGQQQAGDFGLAGWTIQLLDAGGQLVASTQTSSNGGYTFSNVAPGCYTVQEVLQTGWTQTAGPSEKLIVDPNTTETTSFGNFQDITIQGSKFDDRNGDGQWETGEPGLVGWTIQLDTMANGQLSATPLQTTTTDANGQYQFTNLGPLPAGTSYVVAEVQPSGWTQTAPASGSNGTITLPNGLQGYVVQAVSGVVLALPGGGAASISGDGLVTVKAFNNNTIATIGVDGKSEEVYLTQFTATFTAADGSAYTFDTFCEDLEHDVSLGQTSAVYVRNDLDSAFAAGNRIAYIYQTYGTQDLSKNPTQAAAVQVALWELDKVPGATAIQQNPDGSYSAANEESAFSVNFGSNPNTAQIVALVNQYLTASLGAATAGAWADASAQGDYLNRGQSLLIPQKQFSFGDFQNLTIEGSKFNDLNADGQWETGEPPLVGWTIRLYTETGGQLSATPLQTTTTDRNGNYSFTNLGPLPTGTSYVVVEVQPAGWTQSDPVSGAANTITLPDGLQGYVIPATSGVSIMTPSGSSATLSGQGSMTVNAFNNNTPVTITYNGQSQAIYLTQFTVAYTDLSGSQSSFYTFCIDLTHDVSQGQTYKVDARNDLGAATAAASRIAYIYQKYGEQDLSNNPDQAAAVQLAIFQLLADPNAGALTLASDVDCGKASNFFVNFGSNPDASTITALVNQYLGSSYGATTAGAWADASAQGNYLTRGQSMLLPTAQLNFGDYQKGVVYGTVFNDANGNGVEQDGKPGLTGWTVQLLNSSGQVIATTQSDANGNYAFSNLAPGTYSVQEVLQNGWTQTTSPIGSVTVQGGAGSRVDFGNANNTDWQLQAEQRGFDPNQGYLLPIGEAQVDLNSGALILNQALDFSQSDSGRTFDSPSLVYNSNTVDNRPILNATLASSASDPVPTSIVATLTIDGVAQTPVTFSTAGRQPGDTYLLAVQSSTSLSTGIHNWQLEVDAYLPGGSMVTRTESGQLGAVDRTQSYFGAGWSLSNLDQLFQDPTTGNVLWVSGQGESRIFASNGNGTFASPSGDFGTLIQDPTSKDFTYTTPQQLVYRFDANGYLTSKVDPHGLTESFAYNGLNQLAQVTNIDGGVTTLQYGPGNKVSSIAEPGSRTVTLNQNAVSGNLDSLIDENSKPRRFAYTSSLPHSLTQDSQDPWNSSFTYNDQPGGTGRLETLQLAPGSTYQVAPAAVQGMGTAASASQANASVTDGLGLTTSYRLDQYGRPTELTRPRSTPETWARDMQGQVTQTTDFLGRLTTQAYDESPAGQGDLTAVGYADGTSESFAYDLGFHEVTQDIDRMGRVTDSVLDPSNGDVIEIIDPMGRVTKQAWNDGLLTGTTDPLGRVTQDLFNAAMQETASIDPMGRKTLMAYDGAGYATATTDPLGRVMQTLFDGRGELTESVDPLGCSTFMAYDAFGDVTAMTDAMGRTTEDAYDANDDLTASTDPLGRVTDMAYDADGRLTATTDPLGRVTIEAYDTVGDVTATTDPLGRVTFDAYDADGELTASTDPLGRVLRDAFDVNGNLTASTDPMGRLTKWAYDPDGELTATTDPLGRVTSMAFDLDGEITAVTDPLGEITNTSYDADGEVTATTDPLGRITRMAFDPDGELTATTDPMGRVFSTSYDADGEVTAMTDPMGRVDFTSYDAAGDATATTDALGRVTLMAYDCDGELTAMTDPMGRVTSTAYDADGEVTATTDPMGRVSSMAYDADGEVTATTDPLGRVSSMAYDLDGEVTATTDPLGRVTSTAYDPDGEVTASTDPLGRVTSMVYDLDGEVTATTDPLGRVTSMAYDLDGEVTATTDPLGRVTSMAYDLDGEVTATTDPLGRVTSMAYDCDGEITATTDADGCVTSMAYDLDGEVTATTDGEGRVTRTSYDPDGEVTATTDPMGRVTSMAYDADGEVTATTDPLGRVTSMAYDADGEVTATTDAMGRVTNMAYDADGEVTATTDPMGRVTLMAYDADGEVTATTDPLGRVTLMAYDADGEVTATTDALGRVTLMAYDADGEVTATTDPMGRVTLMAYDADGEVTATTDPMGRVTSTSYDADGEVTASTDPMGRVTSMAYDADGEVTATTDPLGRVTTTAYNGDGEATAVTDAMGRVTITAYNCDGEVTATTDPMGRVTSMAYDLAGEMTATTDPMGRVTSMSYDADGEVTATTDPMGRVISTAYDKDGEVTATTDPMGRVTTTSYNADGEVTAVTDPMGRVIRMAYDLDGEETATTDADGCVTSMAYDADGEVTATTDAEGRVTIDAFDADGEITAVTGAMGRVTQMAFDADGEITATTDPLGRVAFTAFDSDGEITATTDPLGRVTNMAFDLDGELTATTDPLGRIFRSGFDADGEITASTDPLGRIFRSAFDADGEITATTDPLGRVTNTAFDADGEITATTDPLGRIFRSGFDADGEITASTDPLGRVFRSAFDADGEVTASTDPLGRVSRMAFDLDGEVTATTDALGRVASMSYNGDGEATAVTDAMGRIALTAYDCVGEVTATTDALGRVSSMSYDADGEETASTDALGRVTGMSYDADGEVTATTDPLGRIFRSAFDADGEITATTDPLGRITFSGFDADGEVTASTDPLGRITKFAFDPDGEVTATTDPLGRIFRSAFDADGEVTATTDPLGRITKFAFDPDGEITATTDPLGRVTNTAYDLDGDPTAVTDPGRVTLTAYDLDGEVTAVTDPLGRVSSMAYDADGEETATTDPMGRVSSTAYDADGEVTATTDPLGRVTNMAYDADGEVTASTDSLGRVSSMAYDADGEVTATTDPLGRVTSMAYDANGEVTATTDPLGRVTSTAYDLDGEATASTDALGRVSHMAYDADGEMTASTDPMGRVSSMAHDMDGEVTATTDALGNVSYMAYDADGEVTASTDPLGRVTNTAYDADGEVTATTDPMGRVTSTAYDLDGEVTAVTDPLGRVTSMAYDFDREVTATTDALGYVTLTGYDLDGEVTATTDPLGHVTSTAYDADGEVTASTDPLGNVTHMAYDADGEMTATTDALGYVSSQGYDAAGEETLVVDADGNRTTFGYDADGEKTSEVNPLNATATWAYDAGGELTAYTDYDGRTSRYAYDSDSELTAETWADTAGQVTDTFSYSYDADGRTLTASDNAGTISYGYDADGEVTSEQQPAGLTLQFAYDGDGETTAVSDSQGGLIHSVYDGAGNLISRTLSGPNLTPLRVDMTYTADNQLASVSRYRNLPGTQLVGSSSYAYDPAGNVTEIMHRDGAGNVLADYQYAYNADNLVSQQVENGVTTAFTYDADNQLTGVSTSGGGGGGPAGYSYDPAGNRTGGTNTIGPNNELLSDGTWNYSYDKNGNLIQKAGINNGLTWTYAYDDANQMISAVETQGSTTLVAETMTYDAMGRRVAHTTYTPTTGTTTQQFAYLGEQIFADLDGSGNVTMRYLLGDQPNQFLARQDANSQVGWYLTDRLGSVRIVLDHMGAVIATQDYDAYGNITSTTGGSAFGRIGYTGDRYDPLSGLLETPERDLNPQTGTWLEPDPMGFAAGDDNLTRYVKNDPVNATDPSGKDEEPAKELSPSEKYNRAFKMLTPEEQLALERALLNHAGAREDLKESQKYGAAGEGPEKLADYMRDVIRKYDPKFAKIYEERERQQFRQEEAKRRLLEKAAQIERQQQAKERALKEELLKAEEAKQQLPQARTPSAADQATWEREAKQAEAASRQQAAGGRAEWQRILKNKADAEELMKRRLILRHAREKRNQSSWFSREEESQEERDLLTRATLLDDPRFYYDEVAGQWKGRTPQDQKLLDNLARWHEVDQMAAVDKLKEAIQRAYDSGKFSGALKESVQELLKPGNLALMLGAMGLVGGLSTAVPPVGAIAAALGYVMFGKSATELTRDWYQFVHRAINAVTDEDLDAAADHFAKAVKTTAGEAGSFALGAATGKAITKLAGVGIIIFRRRIRAAKEAEELKGLLKEIKALAKEKGLSEEEERKLIAEVQEALKRARANASGQDFEGVLRGIRSILPGVKTRKITYRKVDRKVAATQRGKFDSTDRPAFLKKIANHNEAALKKAGLSDSDIALMKQGKVPDGYNVHHKIPIDAGGTNDPSNLILMKNDPYHYTVTNYQNQITKGMKPGEERTFDYPVPDGVVYPP